MIDCTFYGSYYDPQPWTEQACMVEYAVPAGCPIHFVTGASLMASDIQVSSGSGSAVASTATLVDTQIVQLDTVDVYSCNCDHVTEATAFERFAVTAPSLQAGDYATISWPGFSGPAMSVLMQDPGACPTVAWPVNIYAAIACDRCPMDPVGSDMAGSGSDSGSGSGGGAAHHGGCATGSGASVGVVLALLALSGRGSRRRRPSAPRAR